jgi:hypothetical protein
VGATGADSCDCSGRVVDVWGSADGIVLEYGCKKVVYEIVYEVVADIRCLCLLWFRDAGRDED